MELLVGDQNDGASVSVRGTASGLKLSKSMAGLVLFLISAAYFYAVLSKSRSSELWMDEILAVSVARLPSLPGIWAAIWHGTEFSPPTYDILLHYLKQLVGEGHGRLVWRIPSIIAVYGTAVCVYLLVRKHLSPLVALLAFGLVLDSELFDFADQARQYGILSFGLAIALLLWNHFEDTRFRKLDSFALWLVLSGCLCLHFYGVIEVAAIGVAEIIWWASRKQFRLGIWLPLVFTVPVEAAWLPLASHLSAINVVNIRSPGYFGKPTAGQLIDTIYNIVLGGRTGALLLFAALVLIGFAYLLRRSTLRAYVYEDLAVRDKRKFGLSRLEIIMLTLFAIPFIAFALSFLVTHTYASRYALPAALLIAIGPAFMLDRLPSRQIVALALLPLVLGTIIVRAHTPNPLISAPFTDALTILNASRPPFPVVVSQGMLYVELVEAADAKTRSTLVYLRKPADAPNPDPTDERLVASLATFHPEYQVADPAEFLAKNPSFYVLYMPGASVDTTTPWLIKQGLITGLVNEEGNTLLVRGGGAAAH